MSFVLEQLPEEQSAALAEKYNLTNPLLNMSLKPSPVLPARRAYDKEHDAFVVGVGHGQGTLARMKAEGPGTVYDMIWRGKRVRLTMHVDDHNAKGVFTWLVSRVYVPKSLEAEKELAAQLVKEGVACLREPSENNRQRYTYEGFQGPTPIAVEDDDEIVGEKL